MVVPVYSSLASSTYGMIPAKRKTMQETKLTYMLSKLTGAQRDELVKRLGMGTSTFYERRDKPGKFTLEQADTIAAYLEEQTGAPVDVYHMWKYPMEVAMSNAEQAA